MLGDESTQIDVPSVPAEIQSPEVHLPRSRLMRKVDEIASGPHTHALGLRPAAGSTVSIGPPRPAAAQNQAGLGNRSGGGIQAGWNGAGGIINGRAAVVVLINKGGQSAAGGGFFGGRGVGHGHGLPCEYRMVRLPRARLSSSSVCKNTYYQTVTLRSRL